MALSAGTPQLTVRERRAAARQPAHEGALSHKPLREAPKLREPPAPAPPPPEETPQSAPPEAPRPRRPWLRWLMTFLTLALLLGALAASWFLLPVRAVTVTGNRHLSAQQVQALAGLSGERPFGWLYYGPWRAQALRDNPWVAAAHFSRLFPDRVDITVNERQPVAWLRQPDGSQVALAADATPLPDAPLGARPLPVISGWGPDRSADALYAASALSRYNVKSVEYTPTGMTIQTDKGTVWSGDRELLLKYGAALETIEGSRINLYPWGVSVQK